MIFTQEQIAKCKEEARKNVVEKLCILKEKNTQLEKFHDKLKDCIIKEYQIDCNLQDAYLKYLGKEKSKTQKIECKILRHKEKLKRQVLKKKQQELKKHLKNGTMPVDFHKESQPAFITNEQIEKLAKFKTHLPALASLAKVGSIAEIPFGVAEFAIAQKEFAVEKERARSEEKTKMDSGKTNEPPPPVPPPERKKKPHENFK